MRKLTFLLACLILVGVGLVNAQTKSITGNVFSADDGQPVIGATVIVKGTTLGTITDTDGNFKINVPGNAKTLVISYVGMKTVELEAKNGVSIKLESDARQIDEVVVTALGIKRSEKSLGYSTSNIKSEDLLKARETNVLNSLAGKASGVRVNSQSGTLGGSAKIIIRGSSSLSGDNQPLFVVDGFPISNSSSTGGTTKNNVDYGNRVGDINPDDIQSMTILKGGAATALYGYRAKDGAIIITTKRGEKGKASVTINSSLRVDDVLKYPDFQNEYAQGNYGVYDLKYTNGWGPKISEVSDLTFKDFRGKDVTLQAQPNNVKDFFQTGISKINNISLSGGGDNSDYRVSINATNQTGVIPGSSLDKYNFNANVGKEFSKVLSNRVNFSYISTKGQGRPSQSSNNSNIVSSSIYGIPRVVSTQDLKDNFEDPLTGQQIFLSTDKTGNNPYWITKYNKNNNRVDRFLANDVLTIKPLSWLTITNNLGFDIYNEYRQSNSRKGTAGFNNGEFTNVDIYSKNVNNDLLVTADFNLGSDWQFKLTAGNNINERESRSTTVEARNLTIDQLYTYSNASSATPTLGYSKRRSVSAFGDLGVSYKDFAFLNVTGRNDWFSTLPVKSRSFLYPSVTGSLLYSEFLKNVDGFNWLDYGKLRFGIANVGSDLDPYSLDFQYSPTTTVFMQYIGSTTTIFPFGPISTAFTGPRVLPNSNLVPQLQTSYEFGTDIKALNNRVGFGFTFYNSVTTNQLISIDVPISTGYFTNSINAGKIKNQGIELDLNVTPLKLRNFRWDININFAKNKQTVISITDKLKEYVLTSGWSGLQVKASEGGTFGLYGTGWLRDDKGNIVMDAVSGLRKTTPNVRFGNIYPDWTGGINNSFTYKGWGLSFLIDVRKGGVFYSGTASTLRTSGLAAETVANRGLTFIDKGVVLVNGNYVPNTTPVQSMQDFWANYASTSNTEGNVFDATFAKVREVRISYMVPSSFLKNGFIKGLEFALEGRNLFILKSYVPHVDPELNFFGSGTIGEGVEFNSVPSTRSIGLNVKLVL